MLCGVKILIYSLVTTQTLLITVAVFQCVAEEVQSGAASGFMCFVIEGVINKQCRLRLYFIVSLLTLDVASLYSQIYKGKCLQIYF